MKRNLGSRRPLILISPGIDARGSEFHDMSLSLSLNYEQALVNAGASPLILPTAVSREVMSECMKRCDGVLLTGGDDVDPRLYGGQRRAKNKVGETTPDGGRRDYRELILIDETFRQHKPLLAICRGQQLLNVALGGTLIYDIPSELPGALEHNQTERSREIAHEVRLTAGSLLAKISGDCKLLVNSTHHQAVARVARALRPVAVSNDGIVEALELNGEAASPLPFLLAIQFHPERLADRYPEHAAIFHTFVESCASSGN
jgi:putative glutamine amidotransferase